MHFTYSTQARNLVNLSHIESERHFHHILNSKSSKLFLYTGEIEQELKS